MPDLVRRGFLFGGLALIAAPAIVHAGALMPIRGELLTLDAFAFNAITREAIKLFTDCNEYLKRIDLQYEDTFSQLRIRPPEAYYV